MKQFHVFPTTLNILYLDKCYNLAMYLYNVVNLSTPIEQHVLATTLFLQFYKFYYTKTLNSCCLL